jgi:hypothetical protein
VRGPAAHEEVARERSAYVFLLGRIEPIRDPKAPENIAGPAISPKG